MATDQKCLDDLKRKRTVEMEFLTNIRNFTNDFNPREKSITLIEVRLKELSHIKQRFNEIQFQIDQIDVDNFDKALHVRKEFQTDYFAVYSKMQDIIDLNKSIKPLVNNSSNVSFACSQRTQLAPVLPKFEK